MLRNYTHSLIISSTISKIPLNIGQIFAVDSGCLFLKQSFGGKTLQSGRRNMVPRN